MTYKYKSSTLPLLRSRELLRLTIVESESSLEFPMDQRQRYTRGMGVINTDQLTGLRGTLIRFLPLLHWNGLPGKVECDLPISQRTLIRFMIENFDLETQDDFYTSFYIFFLSFTKNSFIQFIGSSEVYKLLPIVVICL